MNSDGRSGQEPTHDPSLQKPRPTAIALCASSATFSVALRTPHGEISHLTTDGRRQAAEATAMLDALLHQAHLRPADVAEIRVDRGPGSYTGLRMAVTFARVLAAFADATICTATSLELLALAAWREDTALAAAPVRPILDARRERVHTARLACAGGRVTLVSPPLAMKFEECQQLVGADEIVLLAPSLSAAVGAAGRAIRPLPGISAADLFDHRLVTEEVPADRLDPLYLMGSYAE